jgi:hypothetical protein
MGFIRGAVWALSVAKLITAEEHDAIVDAALFKGENHA